MKVESSGTYFHTKGFAVGLIYVSGGFLEHGRNYHAKTCLYRSQNVQLSVTQNKTKINK